MRFPSFTTTWMLSIWEKQSLLNFDVIIVGAGLTGLSTAISLKEKSPNLSVLVLEKNILPKGASTRNAGFACFGSLTELAFDSKQMGTENMVRLVQDRWEGLNLLRSRLGDKNIDFQQKGGYELIDNSHPALNKIDDINRLLIDFFADQVFEVKDQMISTFGFQQVSKMIFNSFEGQIDTGKMFRSMYELALSMGVTILTGASINELTEKTAVCEEYQFSSRAVVVTANGFSNELLSVDLVPGRGTVMVVQPEKPLRFQGTFHYDEGYYYFRDYYGKLIFGGGRNIDQRTEETTEFGINEDIQNKLLSDIQNIILPKQSFEVTHRWSGIMAFGRTKQPIVEKNDNGIYLGVRLGGMGVALSSLIGKRLAEQVIQDNF